MLVWRDFLCEDPVPAGGGDNAAIGLPTGKRMYIRPGMCSLIAGLLKQQRCTLAIISCIGQWHCLQIMRLLLEDALPGPWQVEEKLQGMWTSTAGHMQDSSWKGHRSTPPSLWNVCRKQRVYIFDRHDAVEELPNPVEVEMEDGKPASIPEHNHGKSSFETELQRVWSALQECGAGAYGPWNTGCWFEPNEESTGMDKIGERLLGSAAVGAPEYLQQHAEPISGCVVYDAI